jgi:hypothetical protein
MRTNWTSFPKLPHQTRLEFNNCFGEQMSTDTRLWH